MKGIIKIITVQYYGHDKKEWVCSKEDHIKLATDEAVRKGIYLNGYSYHYGNVEHLHYPRFDNEGRQVNGFIKSTFKDAIAWFLRDVWRLYYEVLVDGEDEQNRRKKYDRHANPFVGRFCE